MAAGKPVRVGEMLTRAGILRKQDLNEACAIAEDTGQMIGKVLIMSGYINKQDLQAAVEAQALVRDGHLELELAFVALAAAAREHITLDQSLDQLGWQPQLALPSARLGELLVASGSITPEQLSAALTEVRESITPLGAVLIGFKAISEELLQQALSVQSAIRSGVITKPDGVAKLAAYVKARKSN